MLFVKNFATEAELNDIDHQCIQAARWSIVEQGTHTTMQQVYYQDGAWQDYVPQVAKQMCYRFMNRIGDAQLAEARLVAYSSEPPYNITGDSMVLCLDRLGDKRGTAVLLEPGYEVIDPMDFGQLRFVLFIRLA